MRVTVFDYGAGNLHSLVKAVAVAGTDVHMESDPVRAVETDVLVLPGVGAFGQAAARLARGRAVVRGALVAGLPCLGVCLGMQLLFGGSEEGDGRGIGLLRGRVRRLAARRVPQIGWNTLDDPADALLAESRLRVAYFANSFVCRPDDVSCVAAWCTHERDRFPAMVRCGRAVGVQFHPEKSSRAGVAFIHAFLREAAS